MRLLRFLVQFHFRVWATLTGHLVTGVFAIVEHVQGAPVAGWSLGGASILLFFLAAYQTYLQNERDRQSYEAKFNDRMTEQRREIVELHEHSKTRDTQIEQLVAQIRQLNREADERSVRPAISLIFSVPPLPEPTYDEHGTARRPFRESDIQIRNGSNYDAYAVYLKRSQIGKFQIQSRIEIDVCRDQQRPLEYIIGETRDGTMWGTMAYRHNLTPLPDEVFIEDDCEDQGKMLWIPLTASYRDSLGNRFETDFTLEHHPSIVGFPKISIVGSRRVIQRNEGEIQ